MELILVRHGRTAANELHQYLGNTDQSVTESSLREIKKRKEDGFYPDPAGFKLYTSGMKRTEETFLAVCGNCPHEILPDMREISFGLFECRTYDELKERDDYQAWLSDFENTSPPEGESYREMKERVLRSLQFLTHQGENAMVFTHGGPIAAIMGELFPEENKNFYQWNPHHGEGFRITFTGQKAIGFQVTCHTLTSNLIN